MTDSDGANDDLLWLRSRVEDHMEAAESLADTKDGDTAANARGRWDAFQRVLSMLDHRMDQNDDISVQSPAVASVVDTNGMRRKAIPDHIDHDADVLADGRVDFPLSGCPDDCDVCGGGLGDYDDA